MTSIRTRILLSYLAVLGVSMGIVLLFVWLTAPAAYARHLQNLQAVEETGTAHNPSEAGQGQGYGAQRGQAQYVGFRDGLYEVLGLSTLAATLAALALSILFSRRIISPLQNMMQASERIAAGHYEKRVKVGGRDELAQLADSFNRMAQTLDQTETMRRRLIGDVSHELRTPLTTIKGFAEGLMDGVLPASQETYAEIYKEADRLTRLVEDLQEVSRVEAQAYRLEIAPVELNALAETVAKRLRLALEEKNITFSVKLPASLPPLLGDEDRLIQILTNLAANACQHTPSGGNITLAARPENGSVHVSIQDTGEGIAPEHLPHIFDRFYRVDKSRSRQSGGSGIGLTIARHLVEAHGGRIWAESPGLGYGSTFHFTIPAA